MMVGAGMRRSCGLRAFNRHHGRGVSAIREDSRAVFPDGGDAEGQVIKGMIRRATILATLIIGLMAGPAVSL